MRYLQLYVRVLGMLRSEWRVGLFLAAANLAIAGIGFLEPILFGRVIDLLTRSTTMTSDKLWTTGSWLMGTWVMIGLGGIGAGMIVALLSDRMAHRSKMHQMSKFYSHALGLPLSFHSTTHSGGIMRTFYAGGDILFNLWLGFFRDQFVNIVSVLALLPLTMLLNWRLSLALDILVVLFVSMTSLVARQAEGRQRSVEHFHTGLASSAQDAMTNVMVVQSFRRLSAERQAFVDMGQQVLTHQLPLLNWWALVNVLTRSASTLAVLSVVILGTVLHVRGQASVGDIVSFMGFATMLISRLEGMVWFSNRLFTNSATLDEFFAILDAKSSVPEDVNATELLASSGKVVFDNVSFAYPGGPDILSGVSFTAEPGSVVALVGQTGAGKSTAMNLLQRMWDPSTGSIQIDEQDIRYATLDSLRASVGVVFQESMLFNRSIKDNLLVGKPDATQHEIEHACKQAQAHDFIVNQPKGYDTVVGERGTTLSGGQKQRLAIARALLKNPPILVLDEATSALDSATEAKVTLALKALMKGRTTFIIAHRLSTIRDADQIMVFSGGRVIESGDFDELVKAQGAFAELVASQITPAPANHPLTLPDNVIVLANRIAA